MSLSARLTRTLSIHRASCTLVLSAAPARARLSFSSNAASSSSSRGGGSSQGNFTDPFPFPLSSKSFTEQDPIPEDLLPEPIPRPNESLDALRSRLNYQSRKRGTLESDLLLSTYAKENLSGMSRAELEEFDKLMDEPDWDIYYWAIEKRAPPERWASSPLLSKLRVHARNEGKVVRMMPDVPILPREGA